MEERRCSAAEAKYAEALSSLIYQSGPSNLNAILAGHIRKDSESPKEAHCKDYLRFALASKDGQFGYANQTIVTIDNHVVGCVSCWQYPQTKAFSQATLASLIAYFGALDCALVLKNSAILGALVKQPNQTQLSIGHLAVDRNYRRKGVATELINCCHRVAAAHQKTELILDVIADNTAAVALYQRLGFVQYGQSAPSDIARTLGLQTHLHFKKSID